MIRTMEEVERETVLAAIQETGSAIETARLLKMGKTTVFRKLKKWGVPVPGTNGLRKKKIPAPALPPKQ
jgi:DNA-binding NtrC family response regulator